MANSAYPPEAPGPTKGSSGTGLGLSIAGLVVGLLSLLLAFVPCIGAWAIWPGVLAVVLSGVGMFLCLQVRAPAGLGIAALVISVLAVGIGVYRYMQNREIVQGIEGGLERLEEEGRRSAEDVRKRMEAERKEIEEELRNTENEVNPGEANPEEVNPDN